MSSRNVINFWPTNAADPGGYVIASPASLFVPTPKHLDQAERKIRIEAIRQISFASIIEKAKAEQEAEKDASK